jgi:hypothetical protein
LEFTINSVNESATITLSDGTQIGLPRLKDQPHATALVMGDVVKALLEVAENLDKRLAALEHPAK